MFFVWSASKKERYTFVPSSRSNTNLSRRIFALWKTDLPEDDKLNYKDKFLQANLFQWESMANLPQNQLEKLKQSRFAYLFIRKIANENGIVLPFTYIGKGTLHNCRKTQTGNGTYLFDVVMEHELPDYLQYDFGLTK